MKNLANFILLLNILFTVNHVHPSQTKPVQKEQTKTGIEKLKDKKDLSEKKVLQEQTKMPFATHTLLIFLDDTEVKLSQAISTAFIAAVAQKAGPILVSRNLFINVFEKPDLNTLIELEDKKNKEEGGKGVENVYQKIKEQYELIRKKLHALIIEKNIDEIQLGRAIDKLDDELPELNIEIDEKASTALILETLAFNQDEWIIKLSPIEGMILMIPKIVLNEYKIIPPFQNQDQALGLKLTEWPSAQADFFQNVKNGTIKKIGSQPIWYFLSNLQKMFITRAEYAKLKFAVLQIPRWAIFIAGHGLLDESIVALPLDAFQHFLDFIEKKIITSLLVYKSCYAVGSNEKNIYQDITFNTTKIKTYSYVIATEGIAEALTYIAPSSVRLALSSSDIDINLKKLKIKSLYHFDRFVAQVKETDAIEFEKVLRNILDLEIPNNIEIALIKFPGTEWFNILDLRRRFLSIGNVMAKTQIEPLSINAYTKKLKKIKIEGILLYVSEIPFDIIDDQYQTTPKFISMIPGKSIHHFKQINTLEENFYDFLMAFIKNTSGYARKIFWIGTLKRPPFVLNPSTKEKITVSEPLTNLVIDTKAPDSDGGIDIFFTIGQKEKKYYKFESKEHEVKDFTQDNPFMQIKEDYMTDALKMINQIKLHQYFQTYDPKTEAEELGPFEEEQAGIQMLSDIQRKKAEQYKKYKHVLPDLKKGAEKRQLLKTYTNLNEFRLRAQKLIAEIAKPVKPFEQAIKSIGNWLINAKEIAESKEKDTIIKQIDQLAKRLQDEQVVFTHKQIQEIFKEVKMIAQLLSKTHETEQEHKKIFDEYNRFIETFKFFVRQPFTGQTDNLEDGLRLVKQISQEISISNIKGIAQLLPMASELFKNADILLKKISKKKPAAEKEMTDLTKQVIELLTQSIKLAQESQKIIHQVAGFKIDKE